MTANALSSSVIKIVLERVKRVRHNRLNMTATRTLGGVVQRGDRNRLMKLIDYAMWARQPLQLYIPHLESASYLAIKLFTDIHLPFYMRASPLLKQTQLEFNYFSKGDSVALRSKGTFD